MKTYKVKITETLAAIVEIEAENELDAEQQVSDNWRNSEYILDAANFMGVTFEIVEGEADSHDVKVDGEAQNDDTDIEIDRAVAWEKYLKYLRGWADSHAEPVFYGTTPVCYDEWVDNEYHEEKINGIFEAGSCPKCGCDSLDYDGGDFVITGYMYKWTCMRCGTRGRECYDMTFIEYVIDDENDCPLSGDTDNDCADCACARDYHYQDGQCMRRVG